MARLRPIPASFFGMVLGLVGLGGNWRTATALWGMPSVIGEAIMTVAFVVCAGLTLTYIHKWVVHRQAALEEIRHPVQCCFVGLAPASGALMGIVLAPHSHDLAVVALLTGGAGQVIFQLWRFGAMLQGDRDISTTTPVIYLPSVAGNLIIAIAAGVLGFSSWGILFFGIGVFSWLALESVIVNRLLNHTPLAPPLRPTLGIQLAPPVVAAVAWLANTQGTPELMVQAAWGYGLVQLLLIVRLLPWITKQPFASSYWAFSFGITALSGSALTMTLRGLTGAIADLAPVMFVFTNLVMAVLIVGTIVRLAQNKLLPPAVAPAAASSPQVAS